MAEYIKRQDSLNTGRKKINEELTKANDNARSAKNISNQADNKSDNAVNVANQAMQQSNSTQDQLDNVIIESGTSDAEVIQARTDEKGTTHNTLKKRIDDSFDEVTTQLAETSQHINNLNKNKMDKSVGATKQELIQKESDIKFHLDNQLSQIGSMTPRGAYPTLQALNNAYPNGAEGVFVVQESGHWHYWNGSVWIDGGFYQATPWADFMTEQDEEWVI